MSSNVDIAVILAAIHKKNGAPFVWYDHVDGTYHSGSCFDDIKDVIKEMNGDYDFKDGCLTDYTSHTILATEEACKFMTTLFYVTIDESRAIYDCDETNFLAPAPDDFISMMDQINNGDEIENDDVGAMLAFAQHLKKCGFHSTGNVNEMYGYGRTIEFVPKSDPDGESDGESDYSSDFAEPPAFTKFIQKMEVKIEILKSEIKQIDREIETLAHEENRDTRLRLSTIRSEKMKEIETFRNAMVHSKPEGYLDVEWDYVKLVMNNTMIKWSGTFGRSGVVWRIHVN